MNIKNVPVTALRPYANNPRKNDVAVEKVAASIREFGFKVPLVITSDCEIVAGHTRYKAAQQLGIEEVPCVVADDLTEDQIKAFRLADNKVAEFAEWDWSLLDAELLDIADVDMEQFGFDLPELPGDVVEDDYTPELSETPKAKLGTSISWGGIA